MILVEQGLKVLKLQVRVSFSCGQQWLLYLLSALITVGNMLQEMKMMLASV